MADTDILRPYKRGAAPSLPDQRGVYISEELIRLERAFSTVVTVLKALETRIEALETP